ncbi:hypothetical protein HCN51_45565 [Nonomuraea sp. FMUSA5-5]|uniref:Uncharacterized protein n=1 Tax=Nonomuraea composti TaxID=2720023 RepID=A0ABX1BFT5_9ACTN|nr:hypothetical protein [Nonomuraea sp. FMUSA5-5]NJP96624.1 hypothetical protein [Nonomuraea sp. FMUSA5-5]
MRIRLEGNRAEITLGLIRLREVFTVTAMSRAYPDRAHPRVYRVYVRISPRDNR